MAYTKTEMSNRCWGAEDKLENAQYKIMELEGKVKCLTEVNKFMGAERQFGAPLTFCGFPMDEAVRILVTERKRLRDAQRNDKGE
jgi:hypothetical protein